MDLTPQLSSLIPSMESAALTVLAGTQGALGQSQIHRLAPRGNHRGLGLALDRLVEHGLVVAEPSNHGYLYRLNLDHVLTPRRSPPRTHARSSSAVSTVVLGSVARRESGPASDVDLLVVVPDHADTDDVVWRDRIRHLEAQVLAWSGNRAEIITVTRTHVSELVADGEPIVHAWRADALTLTGTDLQKLLDGTA